MEQRACADSIALLNQGNAAFADNFFDVLDGLEIGVGERLVDKLPKVLGCSSGLWEGWKTRRMPSGTVRFSGPCQPAPSSCSTMRLFLPAPADLAKSARMASNISLQTALETFHTVAPLAGSTKPRHKATRNGDGQAQWAARLSAPIFLAGSALGRSDARPLSRTRRLRPDAFVSLQRQRLAVFFNAARSSSPAAWGWPSLGF